MGSAKLSKGDKAVSAVKNGAVTKPSKTPKAKKEVKDESGSESDSEEEESEDDSADDSDESDSGSDDDSDDDSDDSADEKAKSKAKVNSAVPKAAAAKVNSANESSDSSASSEEDDDDSDSGSDDSDSSGSDEEAKDKDDAPSKKRKAEEVSTPAAKKAKAEQSADGVNDDAKRNLFVGQLSWNVDDEWLRREFESFGDIESVNIIKDRNSGRSKGFGYVKFYEAAAGEKAKNEMHRVEIDGRTINVDFNQPKDFSATPRSDRTQRYGDAAPSEASATLFVANLSFDATSDVVGEEFGKHGDVVGVRLPTDKETGNPKGFGYVEFASIDDAKNAFDKMTYAKIMGRQIRLDYSTPRPPRNDNNGSPNGGGHWRGGRGGGRGGSGFGGGRGGFGGRGGGRGGSTNRGGFGDFQGKKMTFE